MDSIISSVFDAIISFISGIFSPILETMDSWLISLVSIGNNFFNAAINVCTGFLLTDPADTYPTVWSYVKNLAQSSAAQGVANDLFIVFFLISLVNYALSVRSKVDVEDLFKIVARLFVGKFLVLNCVTLIEGFWDVTAALVSTIAPSNISILTTTPLISDGIIGITWLINLVLALVYFVMMMIVAFKLITSTWERLVWVFLAVPFGAPAFATMVGTGQFSHTARAYIRYTVGMMVQFIAYAIMIRILALLVGDFASLLQTGFLNALGTDSTATWVGDAINYFSNICFASLVATIISKLDTNVNRMYGL